MNKLLLCLPLVFLLGGCLGIPKVGPIDTPPSELGKTSPIPSTLSEVTSIQIYYQDKKTVKQASALFNPKGIIKGEESPLIPLDADNSDLDALGIKTEISNDGNDALLTYNDNTVTFKVGDRVLYKNKEEGSLILDAPIYSNSTIYIPIIPLLKSLGIDYKINANILEIGKAYTEESE